MGIDSVVASVLRGDTTRIPLKQFDVGFVNQDRGALLHEVDDDGQAVLGVDF